MLVSPYDKMPSSRSFQYFFVNKRPVSSKILQTALYKAYGDQRPAGQARLVVVVIAGVRVGHGARLKGDSV